MEEYSIIVMSIDPMEDPDDNHQKYQKTVTAESEKQALQIVADDFASRGLPVYWSKVI